MSRSLRQLLIVSALMVAALMLFTTAPSVLAQTTTTVGGGASSSDVLTEQDVPEVVRNLTGGEGSLRALALRIINFALMFLGLVAVVMVIYGGILYVTAAGKDDQAGNGKKVIMYAIVGIIIIMLSFALINTVLKAGTGETV